MPQGYQGSARRFQGPHVCGLQSPVLNPLC